MKNSSRFEEKGLLKRENIAAKSSQKKNEQLLERQPKKKF